MNVKSLLLIIILLVVFSANVFAGSITYNVKFEGSVIDVNLFIELESRQPVNQFLGRIAVPENSVVQRIFDSKGEIEEFELSGGLLDFNSNVTVQKRKEVVGIEMQWNGLVKEEFQPVYCPVLQFSATAGSETEITIDVGEENGVLSLEPSYGFQASYSEEKIEFVGEGATNALFCYANKSEGEEFDHFILFNSDEDISNADDLFYLIPLLLGVQPIYGKYPVLVLEDEEYESKLNSFSEGINVPGSLSVIKESAFEEERAVEIILHEVTHSFNAWVFPWNTSKSAFFDEGIAKTIEKLAKKRLGKRNSNLFYKNIVYIQGDKMITLYPASDWEELLEYYESGGDFVREWNPVEEQRNEFAYAYSELFVRNYIKEKGISGLHEAYEEFLEVGERVSEAEEFYEKLIELLEVDGEPCYFLTENELKTCLERINGFSIQLPEETEVTVLGSLLEGETGAVETIDIAGIKELEKETLENAGKKFEEAMLKLIKNVFNLLENVFPAK